MDYCDLLLKAYENTKNASIKEVRCYETHFSSPGNLDKTVSSANVKKYLARKEKEETDKMMTKRLKKEELMKLRKQDRQSQRRIVGMLRTTKESSKSVIGGLQSGEPLDVFFGDADDYGYVSREAAAFHDKLLHQYQNNHPLQTATAKEDEMKLQGTIRSKLRRTTEYEKQPQHKEMNCTNETKNKNGLSQYMEIENVKPDGKIKGIKSKTSFKCNKQNTLLPPPIHFNELLQIAKKKQFEPILIDRRKEFEKRMTEKQKLEERERSHRAVNHNKNVSKNKFPKLSIELTHDNVDKKPISFRNSQKCVLSNKISSRFLQKAEPVRSETTSSNVRSENTTNSLKTLVSETNKRKGGETKFSKITSSGRTIKLKSNEICDMKREVQLMKGMQKFLAQQVKNKEMAIKKIQKLRTTVNPRVGKIPLKGEGSEKKKCKLMTDKRPASSDSDTDSDMDDFIVDDPTDGPDYSKLISEILGYNKSKYSNDDSECDESSFAQISKEEFVSTKIGLLEDLKETKKMKKMRKNKMTVRN